MAPIHLLRALPSAALTFLAVLSSVVRAGEDEVEQAALAYSVGDAIPITCLNRTIDTGEHVQDEKTGQLQYIPFWQCNETGRPLELSFGTERDVNCTVDSLSDEMYHQLEFYIHNDAPLTCRIPSRPPPSSPDQLGLPPYYTPLTISLAGMLQLSHLHVANDINVVLHAAPRKLSPGTIDAATAYSISPAEPARAALTKVIIGDPLPLRLSVRWYPDTRLPPAWTRGPTHLLLTTLLYCLFSAAVSAVLCIAYFRGIDLPRRLRSHGEDKLGIASWLGRRDGLPLATSSPAPPKYTGYGYGVSSGLPNGWAVGTGKRD